MNKAGRRGFLKAFGLGTAALAATAVAPATAHAATTVERVVEKEVWPDFLPPLVGGVETEDDETRRLLKEVLAAEREIIDIPRMQDVTWNGISFRLNRGPNVVPAPIAYVYRLATQDNHDLEAELHRKYSHTFQDVF